MDQTKTQNYWIKNPQRIILKRFVSIHNDYPRLTRCIRALMYLNGQLNWSTALRPSTLTPRTVHFQRILQEKIFFISAPTGLENLLATRGSSTLSKIRIIAIGFRTLRTRTQLRAVLLGRIPRAICPGTVQDDQERSKVWSPNLMK